MIKRLLLALALLASALVARGQTAAELGDYIAEVNIPQNVTQPHTLMGPMHSDTNQTATPNDGQCILWDTVNSYWTPGSCSGVAGSYVSLSPVSPQSGDIDVSGTTGDGVTIGTTGKFIVNARARLFSQGASSWTISDAAGDATGPVQLFGNGANSSNAGVQFSGTTATFMRGDQNSAATMTVEIRGGLQIKPLPKSADFAAVATASVYPCDATGGNVAGTLPAATGTGQILIVTKTDATAGICSWTRAGSDTINGATTYALPATQYAWAMIQDTASAKWTVYGHTVVAADLTAGIVGTTAIANNAVTNAVSAQMAATTIKGNATTATANASDVAASAMGPLMLAWRTQNQFFFDDFTGNKSSVTSSNGDLSGWLVTNTGTCTACGNVNTTGSDANHQGVLTLDTGTAAAPVSTTLIRNTSSLYFTGGEDITMWVYLSNLSTATDTYTTVFGFCDQVDLATACADGAWFSYTDTSTGAAWGINTANNSTPTNVSCSNVVTTAAAWHKLHIHADSTTSMSYDVDGTACTNSPITTNIPITAGRYTSIEAGMRRTAGTTSRSFSIDAIGFYHGGITR